MRFVCAFLIGSLATSWPWPVLAQPGELEEIVVTAALREQPVATLPVSVTVLDAALLGTAAVQHFEELALRVPNLNISGEGARTRYFQLRGIGELEQYEGAPNPSIGFVIDDIDFSALGSIATLFDLESVEVLRGPQGTRYGANALGGMIYARSAPPPNEYSARLESTLGSENTWSLGAAAGGPLSGDAGWQLSVHQFRSDGFRQNTYLQSDDTDGQEELTARAKLALVPGARARVDLSAIFVDARDGYDAWTIDSDLTTESDRPGRDEQQSLGASARVELAFESFDLISISSYARSDADLAFDADWGNPQLWDPYTYDYFSQTLRERRTTSQELRFVSNAAGAAPARLGWVAGVYALDLAESNERNDAGIFGVPDDAPDVLESSIVSDYDARHLALFGQVELPVGERVELQAGLRWEQRTADFQDTAGNVFDPVDRMLGGELAAVIALDESMTAFVRLARGYRAGGFNLGFAGMSPEPGDDVVPVDIEYAPEFLWNLELGLKGRWLDDRLAGELSVFAARRDEQQIKVPVQLRLGDPSSFMFLTANAERGQDYGIEAELRWQATQRLDLAAAVGLLRTKIERFSLLPALEGRAQAHAPDYSLTLSAVYEFSLGWWARADVIARDSFYFDYSHDQKSRDYVLPTLRFGRDWGSWSAAFWVRNLTAADYTTRGFYFGNEPPDFPQTLYTRLGNPRQIGLTLRYRW
jgi:iron complex outermembrane receptor protein